MSPRVTLVAEGTEVLLIIRAAMAAQLDVVDLQVLVRSALLASPAVTLENALLQDCIALMSQTHSYGTVPKRGCVQPGCTIERLFCPFTRVGCWLSVFSVN